MYRVVMVAVAVVLVVAGCGGDVDPGSGADPSPTGSASPVASGAAAAEAFDPVDEAVAGFAAYAEVDHGEVEVVAHEEVTWRDGSLGCPDPDTRYTQELVEGYRIVLRAGEEEAAYHGRQGMPPFYCAGPDPGGTVEDRPEASETSDEPDKGGSG